MSDIAKFNELLFSYANADTPENHAAIEAKLWSKFRAAGAVFILDMSGFSRLTQQYGIVYYLSMILRMQTIVTPIIERYKGNIVKFEADNCFAYFPDVDAAVDAAIGIFLATAATNRTSPDELDILLSCGIDYGEFLLIENDYFGDPVNRACKLGEDLGLPNEILITQKAKEKLSNPSRFDLEDINYSIAGIPLAACRVDFPASHP